MTPAPDSIMRFPTRISILVFLFLFTGCTLHMDAPESYLKLAHAVWPCDYQAVSSDDCRLTAREIQNPEEGGLEFWSKAIQNQMVQAKGYKLISEHDRKTNSGWIGRELLFSTHSKGVEYYYLLTFFPVGTKIYLVEAGGERKLIEDDLDALREAVFSLRYVSRWSV